MDNDVEYVRAERIEELEAKLVKAQAALREIDNLCPTDRIDEYASQILYRIIMQVGQVSRYAMRELVAEASAAKMCCLNLPDAECANAPRDLPQNRGHNCKTASDAYRIEELEAKLAKAMDALESVISCSNDVRLVHDAEATLTEIKGQNQ
jgi:hypothetical protein